MKPETPGVGEFFGRHQVAEHKASGSLRPHWRGGFDLPLGSRAPLELFAFQAAAVLGAMQQAEALLGLLRVHPGGNASKVPDAGALRAQGLQQLDLADAEPVSFWSHLRRIRFPGFDASTVNAQRSKWVKLDEAFGFENEAATAGAALGLAAPDFVEDLWGRTAQPDPERWREAVDGGLRIPSDPVNFPLDEFESWVLAETLDYVTQHAPQLATQLLFGALPPTSTEDRAADLTSLGSFWIYTLLVHP